MRQKAIKYVALATLLLGYCAMNLIAPSLAHGQNTASWQNVLDFSGRAMVTSDLLSADGTQVELSTMPEQRDIVLQLTSEGGAAAGSFTCEPGEYLTASFDQSRINLPDGGKQTVNLTLTKTAEGMAVTQAQTAVVRVIWTPDNSLNKPLWADILVPLVPAEQAEPAISDVSVPEGTSETPVETLITHYTPTYSGELPMALEISGQGNQETIAFAYNGEAFPALTRYWVNGSSTVLYDGGSISLHTTEAAVLFVDTSNTELASSGACTISARVRAGDQTLVQELQIEATPEPFAEPEETPILTETMPLVLPVQTKWPNCECDVTLFRLDAGESGSVVWTPVDKDGSGIEIQQNAGQNLQLSLGETNLPPAGTYRVDFTWKFNGKDMLSKSVVFFIQYSSALSAKSVA